MLICLKTYNVKSFYKVQQHFVFLIKKCNGKNYVENLRQLHESCRCEILQRPYISQVKELKNKTEKALEQKYKNFVKSNTEYKVSYTLPISGADPGESPTPTHPLSG